MRLGFAGKLNSATFFENLMDRQTNMENIYKYMS